MKWSRKPPEKDGFYWVRGLTSLDEDWVEEHFDEQEQEEGWTGIVRFAHDVYIGKKAIAMIYLPGIEEGVMLTNQAGWNAWAGPLPLPKGWEKE